MDSGMFSKITTEGTSNKTVTVNQHSTTDKDYLFHGYMEFYDKIIYELGLRKTCVARERICELGVLCGGSLALWKERIPNAIVVGVDNNPEAMWPEGTHKVLMDQDDPKLPEILAAISPEYDMIVDDCSHIGYLTMDSFRLLWPLVRPGGYYVIEDWLFETMGNAAEHFFHMMKDHPAPFDTLTYFRGNSDISGLVVIHKAGLT